MAKMTTLCKALALLMTIGPRPARRWAAGPPVQPARPPCASESLRSRAQRWGRVRARKDALKKAVYAIRKLRALSQLEREAATP